MVPALFQPALTPRDNRLTINDAREARRRIGRANIHLTIRDICLTIRDST